MTEEEVIKAENDKMRLELVRTYKRVFMGEDGEKVLADLEIMCGFLRTSIGPEDRWNTNQLFYHEGMRNIYLHIKRKLDFTEKENG